MLLHVPVIKVLRSDLSVSMSIVLSFHSIHLDQVRQLHTQAKKSEIEEELEMLEALAKKTTEMKELNYIEVRTEQNRTERQEERRGEVTRL